jgi:peptide/nickel transport system substrate-binding protein
MLHCVQHDKFGESRKNISCSLVPSRLCAENVILKFHRETLPRLILKNLRITLVFVLLALLLAACEGETTEPTATPGQRTGAPNLGGGQGANGNNSGTNATSKAPPAPTATSTAVPSPVPTNTPAPTPTAIPPLNKGGNVTGALLNDALTLHPYKQNNASGDQLTALLYAAALTRRDPNPFALLPGAAASWSVNNTALTVTFKLKDNLRWSDGQSLTSSDYLWTYEQLKKPGNTWPYASSAFYSPDNPNSDGIESMTAPDPKTLVVKLHALSYEMAARADVIEPLPRQTWEGKDWNDPAKNPEINKPSVVSGPWKLKEWKQDDHITFAANDASALYPRPNLDSLTFQVIPDSATAMQRLKGGEIDFFRPDAAELSQFEKLPNTQTYRWTPDRPTWQYLGFNFRRAWLQDRALRQAMAYATDRKTILDKLAFGLGRPLYSDVVPWHPYFVPNVPRYDFNLELAQRVLKDAGYTVKDGYLTDRNNIPLPTLKLIYNTPSPLRDGIANQLKQAYGALGIHVEITGLDDGTYQRLLSNPGGDYDLFLGGWTADLDPEQFGAVWDNIPELNSGAYGNEKLTGLYSQAQKEPDSVKRKDLMAQIQRLEAQELPYIYLYADLDVMTASKRVAGFTTTTRGPAGNLYTDWFVVK